MTAATPEQVLAAVAAVLFEGDEPAELRAERAAEVLERHGVNYCGEIAAATAAPGDFPGMTATERADAIGQLEERLVEAERAVDDYRELLDEIGTLAANAPEDDAFSVCEEIAMRVAAHGVPAGEVTGRAPGGTADEYP